ncbi:MAG TPA: hypothetical protein VF692_13045 [Pyrinomonadaceae bacterium]
MKIMRKISSTKIAQSILVFLPAMFFINCSGSSSETTTLNGERINYNYNSNITNSSRSNKSVVIKDNAGALFNSFKNDPEATNIFVNMASNNRVKPSPKKYGNKSVTAVQTITLETGKEIEKIKVYYKENRVTPKVIVYLKDGRQCEISSPSLPIFEETPEEEILQILEKQGTCRK